MKTVADFLRARASLRVECYDCGHHAFFGARFLKERLGPHARVIDAPFTCSKCGKRRVRLATGSEAAADKSLAKGIAFGGIYEKYED
jgi:DNA-directed RNA polymerase subunit RPC12/RpoP